MIPSSPVSTQVSGQVPRLWVYLSPYALVCNLWRYRAMIWQFTRREVEGRYRGSFLGLLWSFINPLVLLLIYTFVFGVVFKSRWQNSRTGGLGEFALVLFCGLTAFSIFSECVHRAAHVIVQVPNYVKKVVFPLEILPVSLLGAALFHASVSLGILIVANVVLMQALPWTLVLLPVVLLPLVCLCLGLAWFLASLGVFIRDIGYTVTLVVQVLFFTTPIFYSIESIPLSVRVFIRLNPLASIVENVRRVVLWGQVPDWSGLLVWGVITLVGMQLGYAWFMRTKRAFADVL